MDEEKRGPGRPPKLPKGKKIGVRCILVNGEKEKFDVAKKLAKMSQVEFTRAAVLHAVDSVMGVTPPHPKPVAKEPAPIETKKKRK